MDNVGRYEINSKLGQGASGSVYRAYDPRLERAVAIKIIPAHLTADPTFIQRFGKEARIIASLDHPAIVPVYDFGGLPDGQFYLVMRLMTGGSLSDLLDKGPLNLEKGAFIYKRICSALDYAHSRGIVHRDLKPSNILFDQYGNAFLTDFGIVRIAYSGPQFTATGSVVGTPAYMSPEQVKGINELDGRTDIYALGIILYEMVTGQRPFTGNTPITLLMKHILDPVPRPSDINPSLPTKYDEIILRALAKDPKDRYPTAGELAKDLSLDQPSSYFYSARKKETRYHEARVLDVAIAEELIVQQVAELIAMVRRAESGGLRAVLHLEIEYTTQPEDVVSKPFRMEFAIDERGEPQAGELLLRVESPDFEPTLQEKSIYVPVAGDSEPIVFLLTPQRLGELVINLELYRQKIHIAHRLLRVNGRAPGTDVSGEQTIVSIPLSVFSTLPASQQALLHNILNMYFSLEELGTLCLQLSIDFENLEGQTKSGKAKALVDYAARHGQLTELVAAIQQERPNLNLKIETEFIPSTETIYGAKRAKRNFDPAQLNKPPPLPPLPTEVRAQTPKNQSSLFRSFWQVVFIIIILAIGVLFLLWLLL